MMRKGQLVVADVFTAFAVFLLIVDASILMWDYELFSAGQIQSNNLMEEAARAASSQLMTSGDPSNWQLVNITNVSLHSFGLASSPNVIDSGKLQALGVLSQNPGSYPAVKKALGLDCCDMWLGVLYENGTVAGSFGSPPPSSTQVVSIDRKAALNSSMVTVRLEVWG